MSVVITCVLCVPARLLSKVAADYGVLWSQEFPTDISLVFVFILGVVTILVAYLPLQIIVFASPIVLTFALKILFELGIMYFFSLLYLHRPDVEELNCAIMNHFMNYLTCLSTVETHEIVLFDIFIIFLTVLILSVVIILAISCKFCEYVDCTVVIDDSVVLKQKACMRKISYLLSIQILLHVVNFIESVSIYFLQANPDNSPEQEFYFYWKLFSPQFFLLTSVVQIVLSRDAHRKPLKIWAILIISVCNVVTIIDFMLNRMLIVRITSLILVLPVMCLLQIAVIACACLSIRVNN